MGKRCCCAPTVSCTIFADSFGRADDTDPGTDWVVEAGTCPLVSGHLEPSANARVIAVPPHPDGSLKGISSVTIPLASVTAGDVVKLYVSYLDSSNHFVGFFTAANSGGMGGSIVVKDSAGTTIASHSQNTFKAAASGTTTLTLCWSGAVLYGNAGGADKAVGNPFHVGYGTQAGFGTGTLGGTLQITSFAFVKYGEDGNGCPTCVGFCPQDCSGAVAGQFKLEWSGLYDHDGLCPDCANIDSGTVYLDWCDYVPAGIFNPAVCEWYYGGWIPIDQFPNCDSWFDPSQVDCFKISGSDAASCGTPVPEATFVFWRVHIVATGGHYYLDAEFVIACSHFTFGGSGGSMIFRHDLGTTLPDCIADIPSPVTMTFFSNQGTPAPGTDFYCWLLDTATVILTLIP